MTKLYHARRVPGDPVQEELGPTEAAAQSRNGKLGQYLYATHRRAQAFLYALPFPGANAGVSFMDTAESDTHDEVIVRFHGEESRAVRGKRFKNRVYSVSQDGFEQVNKNPREWISREAKRAQVEAVVDDINQVLREGVQYFTLSQGASKDSFEAADRVSRSGGLSRDFIAKLIAHPKSPCIWENEKDGIGLDSKLAERVDELRLRYVAEILGENPSPYDIKEWAQQWSRSGSTEKMKGVSMEESVTSSQLRFDGNLNHEKRMLLKAAVSKLQDVKEQEIGVISKSKVNSWRERRLSLVECEETNPSAHGQTHPRK